MTAVLLITKSSVPWQHWHSLSLPLQPAPLLPHGCSVFHEQPNPSIHPKDNDRFHPCPLKSCKVLLPRYFIRLFSHSLLLLLHFVNYLHLFSVLVIAITTPCFPQWGLFAFPLSCRQWLQSGNLLRNH